VGTDDEPGEHLYQLNEVATNTYQEIHSWNISRLDTQTTFNEAGSYYDRPTAGGGPKRVQEAEYERTETAIETTDAGFTQFDDVYDDPPGLRQIDNQALRNVTKVGRRTEVEGWYDEFVQLEARTDASSRYQLSEDRDRFEDIYDDGRAGWIETIDRLETFYPEEGQPHGLDYLNRRVGNTDVNQDGYGDLIWIETPTGILWPYPYYEETTTTDPFAGTPPPEQTPITTTKSWTIDEESSSGGFFSVPPEDETPHPSSRWSGGGYQNPIGVFFGTLWDTVKRWDNEEVVENQKNLRADGYGPVSSWVVGSAASVGERFIAGSVANATSGIKPGVPRRLTTAERWTEGAYAAGEFVGETLGAKGAGSGIKQAARQVDTIIKAGFDKIDDLLAAAKRGIVGKTDDAGTRAKFPRPKTSTAAIAPDNFRGRYNADRHARGLPRLPDDYDAHHAIPQRYTDYPEFKDFDFHAPSNIRGVKGARADVNIHQQITNRWEDFARSNPYATRSEIEAFRDQIANEFSEHWFQ
jgi:hypothetical protein